MLLVHGGGRLRNGECIMAAKKNNVNRKPRAKKAAVEQAKQTVEAAPKRGAIDAERLAANGYATKHIVGKLIGKTTNPRQWAFHVIFAHIAAGCRSLAELKRLSAERGVMASHVDDSLAFASNNALGDERFARYGAQKRKPNIGIMGDKITLHRMPIYRTANADGTQKRLAVKAAEQTAAE
jgi:hypothetical protein